MRIHTMHPTQPGHLKQEARMLRTAAQFIPVLARSQPRRAGGAV